MAKLLLRSIQMGSEILRRAEKALSKYPPLPVPRGMIEFIAKSNSLDLVGVEIGVYLGENAASILSTLSIKKLILVDPYLPYNGYSEKGWDNFTNTDYNGFLGIARRRLREYEDRITFVPKMSAEAIHRIPDNLDFVYIDGNHAYEFVKQDIELYYPKIKTGGVMGGDDFEPAHLGVACAVIEFANKHNLRIQGRKYDWWIVKE